MLCAGLVTGLPRSLAQQPSTDTPQLSGHAQQAPSTSPPIEFSDKPDFTVAGVTDWTAVGGHGSDATLRTSESLARETLTLQAPPSGNGLSGNQAGNKSPKKIDIKTEARLRAALAADPASSAANRALGEFYLHAAKYSQALPLLEAASRAHPPEAQDEYDLALACRGLGDIPQARQHLQRALLQKDSADFHRLAGELDELAADPLAAEREFETAAHMQPTEENDFAWGSELLLHRAVWQAGEVFESAAKAYPASVRLKTAWGTALFAGALYDRAAEQFCQASDLDPANPETYLVMGRADLAAPVVLPCIEQRLSRFLKLQPENASANFLYAMALLKRDRNLNLERSRTLLATAVTLDPKYSDAYLQLGILSFAQRRYPEAIGYYTSAVAADPQQGEAHYRLALAYDRIGEADRAKQELRVHDEIEQAQADAVEQQRRQIKQFLVVPEPQPPSSVKP